MSVHPHPPKNPKPAWNSIKGKVHCKKCRNGKVEFKVYTGNAWASLPADCPDCLGTGWLWPQEMKG